ncbi:MAG: NAD(P)/FAD-dependent oxidoreductase [Anaerolineaceae bacterium]|nr:NAD(P)/FAD-dependent oxidoreductase [Anaerolineaceae bacterium]
MSHKKIVIIGAGISGLSAGCYARMNGYEVEIHEAHTQPGGLCTGWKRGEYWIDGCLHWLMASRPGSELHKVWEELGAVQGRQFYHHDVFSSLTGLDGRKLSFYTDVDRLEDHLNQLSPRDARATRAMCALIRRMGGFQAPIKTPEVMGPLGGVAMMAKMLPYMNDFMEISSLTLGQLGARFQDPLICQAISNVIWDDNIPALALILTLAQMNRKDAGFPLGGSLAFARSIAQRFLDLGGRIVYRSRVSKILERNGQVCGVQLADGAQVDADYVISASDLHKTLYALLDGSRVDPLHRQLLETGRTYAPMLMVTFGVNMDFSHEITCIGANYQLAAPLILGGMNYNQVGVKNYCYDPSMAPAGKSVVGAGFNADWKFWEGLPYNSPAYCDAKEHILEMTQGTLEQYYPGFASRIEMVDVATPHSYERYTANRHGIFMSWVLDGEFQRRHPYIPKTVPGLGGLYLASMWTKAPGGVPGAALAGRDVVQIICRQEGKRFVAARP